ncbi:hypothetical protein H4W80_003652 [Nonomuraea angiospora]|uniref:Amidohydrolase n=1 Tax=Nonomuraea angiospora TaxID=46172 RepID=A0ABR9LXL9_9ACTN|nr:hypothetical protein [Nonomuraea angiospora]
MTDVAKDGHGFVVTDSHSHLPLDTDKAPLPSQTVRATASRWGRPLGLDQAGGHRGR